MKRGRPRQFGQMVSLRLPSDLHDALCVEAIRRDIPLSDLMREYLISVSQNAGGFKTSAYYSQSNTVS